MTCVQHSDMEHLPPLLDAMRAQVRAKCAETLCQARERAASIGRAAAHAAEERKLAALSEAREVMAREREASIRTAERLAGRERAAAQGACIEEVLEQARRAARGAMDGADGERIVSALLQEAVDAVEGDVEILAPRRFVPLCEQRLSALGVRRARVSAADDLHDGIIVQDADRTFRVTNTLGARLDRRLKEARRLCHTMLFGDSA